jgi:predicted GIY-YIG superfamily endonuclease
MASREYRFYTDILGSISGTLYIGMTNNLAKRVWQHKHHEFPGCTSRDSTMFAVRSTARNS